MHTIGCKISAIYTSILKQRNIPRRSTCLMFSGIRSFTSSPNCSSFSQSYSPENLKDSENVVSKSLRNKILFRSDINDVTELEDFANASKKTELRGLHKKSGRHFQKSTLT